MIVPGLGGFLVDEKSAKANTSSKQYLAPRSTIAFNQNLTKSDGLLYNAMTDDANITYPEAQQLVQEFVAESSHF